MRTALIAGQILVTALLFWYIGRHFGLAAALSHLWELAPQSLLAAVALYLVEILLLALRLRVTVRALGGDCTLTIALRAASVGLFFGLTPASVIGGDVARVWILARDGMPWRPAASSVALDRIFGFLGLMTITVVALPSLWHATVDPKLRSGITLALGGACLAPIVFLWLRKLPNAVRRFAFVDWIAQASLQFQHLLRRSRTTGLILTLAIAVHIGTLLILYSLARGVGAGLTLVQVFYLAPFPLLCSMIPISLGGWGVREATIVIAFGLAGVAPEKSLLVSILYGLLSVGVALPGGLFWLRGYADRRRNTGVKGRIGAPSPQPERT